MKTFCSTVLLLCAAASAVDAQSLRAKQKQMHSVAKKATQKEQTHGGVVAESVGMAPPAPLARNDGMGHQGHAALKKMSKTATDRADADRWSASADHRRLSEVRSVEADKAKAKHDAAVAAAGHFNTAKISHHEAQLSSQHATATATATAALPQEESLPAEWVKEVSEHKIIFDLADKVRRIHSR